MTPLEPTIPTIPIIGDKTEQFTDELTAYARSKIPMALSNREFADASSALLIALNRVLAATAASFGETHNVAPEKMVDLVIKQFAKHHLEALAAIHEPQGMVQ